MPSHAFLGARASHSCISQKMLIQQQLRELERDGIVLRTIYPQIPPRVEYQLTKVGMALRPALRAVLAWAALRKEAMPPSSQPLLTGMFYAPEGSATGPGP
jgi:DNA-binding HxlR family transcriptional regulator